VQVTSLVISAAALAALLFIHYRSRRAA